MVGVYDCGFLLGRKFGGDLRSMIEATMRSQINTCREPFVERERISEALTYDQHFEQVGFRALLRE